MSRLSRLSRGTRSDAFVYHKGEGSARRPGASQGARPITRKEAGTTATLHLMVGLPCSGKTTFARTLEERYAALRLTPDEWHIELFGNDMEDEAHDARHDAVERLMWSVAAKALARGVDVVLDFGFWGRDERETFRRRAEALGAEFRIHYMDVPEETLLERLAVRNAQLPPGTFPIPEERLREWIRMFEPPTREELER